MKIKAYAVMAPNLKKKEYRATLPDRIASTEEGAWIRHLNYHEGERSGDRSHRIMAWLGRGYKLITVEVKA